MAEPRPTPTASAGADARPAGPSAPTFRQRARFALFMTAIRLVCAIPERPLLAAADAIGGLWYRLDRRRREQAGANLARVTAWMAEHDIGSAGGRAAGRDPGALEALVRDAFRHSVRYNLILARATTMTARYVERWVVIDTPDVLQAALDAGGSLFVGLHMGSMELPGLYLSQMTGKLATTPSETLTDPLLQGYMASSRLRMGVRIVDLRHARSEMVAAIRRGEPVGIVGDRDFTGGGIEVPFFGAPASLPVGPALLALETGVTPHVFGVRRAPDGVYHATIVPVPLPASGSRRERVTAYLEAEARAFERHVAEAPEQWFAVFFPIWRSDVPTPAMPATDPGAAG